MTSHPGMEQTIGMSSGDLPPAIQMPNQMGSDNSVSDLEQQEQVHKQISYVTYTSSLSSISVLLVEM